MANDRLKRRLLHELVRENVDLIEGGPARRLRRQHRARQAARLFALALVPLGLVGSSRLLSTLAADRPSAVSVVRPGRAVSPQATGSFSQALPARSPSAITSFVMRGYGRACRLSARIAMIFSTFGVNSCQARRSTENWSCTATRLLWSRRSAAIGSASIPARMRRGG